MTAQLELDLFAPTEAPAPPVEDHAPAPPPERSAGGSTTGLGAAWVRTVGYWPDHTRVTWTAPWDCGEDTKAGDVLDAVRCLWCGQIEVNEVLLSINHGIEFGRPETWQTAHLGGRDWCSRQELTANQAIAAAERSEDIYVCRYCRIHGTRRDLVREPYPYECRGERAGHDWRALFAGDAIRIGTDEA